MFRVLVGEESRDLEMFLIGFQDFLGVIHLFQVSMSYQKRGNPSKTRESGVFLLCFPYGQGWLRFRILLDH
jgi:hypothetical protein